MFYIESKLLQGKTVLLFHYYTCNFIITLSGGAWIMARSGLILLGAV